MRCPRPGKACFPPGGCPHPRSPPASRRPCGRTSCRSRARLVPRVTPHAHGHTRDTREGKKCTRTHVKDFEGNISSSFLLTTLRGLQPLHLVPIAFFLVLSHGCCCSFNLTMVVPVSSTIVTTAEVTSGESAEARQQFIHAGHTPPGCCVGEIFKAYIHPSKPARPPCKSVPLATLPELGYFNVPGGLNRGLARYSTHMSPWFTVLFH